MKNTIKASLEVELVSGSGTYVTVGNAFWDKVSGGGYKLSEVKYTPFDDEQRVFVGKKETDNVTLEAAYDTTVHSGLLGGPHDESDLRGHRAKVTVLDKVPGTERWEQRRAPYEGVVLDITGPDGDSNDASTLVDIAIVISVGSTKIPS